MFSLLSGYSKCTEEERMRTEINDKKRKIFFSREVLTLLIGSLFYAVGYRVFIEPCRLILGGATGAATLLHGLFSLPVGVGVVAVNLPLFLWNMLRHGWHGTVRVFCGITVTSLFLELFAFLPAFPILPSVGAVLGGVVSAIGIAVLLLRDYTTGGSELAAALIRERFSVLTVGKTVLLIDTAIVLLSVFLLGRSETLFSSILLNCSFAIVLDLLCSGMAKRAVRL